MASFKKVSAAKKSYASPLDLFPDLRPRKLAAPYDHQATLLRDYAAKGITAKDVAIQGATGSGKTFVGLLIAEWRRRQLGERCIYLCPTKQLVHQVAGFASEQMGLPAVPFVGSKFEYSPPDKAAWQMGEALAVTAYSSLFNVNPFFASPNFIVIDDAHAADQYIGEYWTVRLEKADPVHLPIFNELVSVLRAVLPADELIRLQEEPSTLSDNLWVQLAPAPLVWKRRTAISAVLDQAQEKSDLAFRWSVIKGHLHCCQVYVSPHEILIRPVLPPTAQFEPFSAANQRLYMSATLGRGGELERLSGRKGIVRLPSPNGWNGNGVGRRFFLFPGLSLDDQASRDLIARLIRKYGRALYLAATDRSAQGVRELITTQLKDFCLFGPRELEASKTPFTAEPKAVAVLANRYDGIDFPNDDCRMLVVEGRPSGASLQERFLADKLGARALYSERIRTRILQAFGRCTRSANDYALVVPVGNQLMDELLLRENVSLLDRELQAELSFGQEQSRDSTVGKLTDLAEAFRKQGDEWREAEADIVALRDRMTELTPTCVEALEASAQCEIDYISRLWAGDFAGAVDSAQQTLTAIAGGDELRGYRAWWHYLAGCAAQLDADERHTVPEKASNHFRLARNLGGVRWLSGLVPEAPPSGPERFFAVEDSDAIETFEAVLCELGLTNEGRFADKVTRIRAGLGQHDAKQFERARLELGELLGFKARSSSEDGAPDPWWIAGDRLCIVFEDHSQGTPGNDLSLEKARQVASHEAWIRERVAELRKDAKVISVLVTPADASSPQCKTHLKKVAVWPLEEFRAWANEVLTVVRTVRARLARAGDLVWRMETMQALEAAEANPSSLVLALLRRMPGDILEKSEGRNRGGVRRKGGPNKVR